MARQIITWYRQRWHIEQYFRLLKSKGLNLEGALLEDGQALQRLCLMALGAALKVMLLLLAREGARTDTRTGIRKPLLLTLPLRMKSRTPESLTMDRCRLGRCWLERCLPLTNRNASRRPCPSGRGRRKSSTTRTRPVRWRGRRG